jgi:hypothetical protein
VLDATRCVDLAALSGTASTGLLSISPRLVVCDFRQPMVGTSAFRVSELTLSRSSWVRTVMCTAKTVIHKSSWICLLLAHQGALIAMRRHLDCDICSFQTWMLAASFGTPHGSVIDEYGTGVEWYLAWEYGRTRRKKCCSATSSTTNVTWIHPELNPSLRGKKPASSLAAWIESLAVEGKYLKHFGSKGYPGSILIARYVLVWFSGLPAICQHGESPWLSSGFRLKYNPSLIAT